MSEVKIQKSEILTLHTFDSHDDCMLDVIQNMSPEDHEVIAFDDLGECVSSFESKDSGINLSPGSTDSSNTDFQVDNLDGTYKSTDLCSIEFNLMKIDNIFLQTRDDLQEGIINEKTKMTTADVLLIDSCKNSNENFDKYNQTVEVEHSCTKENENVKDSFCIVKNDTCKKGSVMLEGPNNNCANKDTDQKQLNTCEQCSMTFTYKRHLDRHLEGHQKNNCPHCNAKFARRKHLEVHLFRIHNERSTRYPHTCDICSHGFPKRILLDRHRLKHNCENQKVDSEGSKIITDGDGKEQIKQHTQENTLKCSEISDIKWTYDTHIQSNDNHKCKECNIIFTSKKKVTNHLKAVHRPQLNKIIDLDSSESFIRKDNYFQDLESVFNFAEGSKEDPTKASFSCSICSKELISQRALVQHIRRIHKEDKRFTCNMYGCTFQCARRTDLDRHKQLHIEERNVICEQCGKSFTSVSILNDHVLYVHNKERQFICEECGKAFKRNSLLKRHKLSHQQLRPFACAQCNAAFKRSHHLTRHMESCHRITLEKKQKVVKLMKTENGHLVPVPEKPKNLRTKKMKAESDNNVNIEYNKNPVCPTNSENVETPQTTPEVQLIPCSNNEATTDNLKVSSMTANLTSVSDLPPQVLSLVDIQSGQILTVEVTSPETLPATDLVDHFETNYNEIPTLPDYQDLELQTEILDPVQSYYDTNYSTLSLQSAEETSLLLDIANGKMDSLSTIDSYLTQPFLPFLNL